MSVSRLRFPTFYTMSNSKGAKATGGTITTSGSYTIHTFSTIGADEFYINVPTLDVDILLVGGGGAGGYWGGGGGAGGFFSATATTFTGGKAYPVWVGAGGVPSTETISTATPYYFGGPGDSSLLGRFVALGGGGGAAFISTEPSILNETIRNYGSHPLQHGGSGGGGSGGESGYCTTGGAALTSLFGFTGTPQGNRGGHGRYRAEGSISGYAGSCGGGGASTPGTNHPSVSSPGTVGGNGLPSSISGSSVTYAGGGGGSSRSGGSLGGSGGGGDGADSTTQNNGTDGLGGGGGGQFHEPAGDVNSQGGTGGSGVVIIRYLT
jgi:hypothetical protein